MSMLGKWVSTPMWTRALVVEERDEICRVDIAAGIPGAAARLQWEASSHLRVLDPQPSDNQGPQS